MKLVKPQHHNLPQESGIRGIYNQIELAAKIHHNPKDEIMIGPDSDLVQRLINAKLYEALEHGTVYLKFPMNNECLRADKYESNPYSIVHNPNNYLQAYNVQNQHVLVTTNYRVIIENHWEEDLKYICEPIKKHSKRYSVVLTTSKQVVMELLKHNTMCITLNSTEYYDCYKNDSNKELEFITPSWLSDNPNEPKLIEDPQYIQAKGLFIDALEEVEFAYAQLVCHYGWKPQQASVLLPDITKTSVMLTGFAEDWKSLFNKYLNTNAEVYNDIMSKALTPIYYEFVRHNYIKA